MYHGFDHANAALERLRASWKSASISDGMPLIDGIWVDRDMEAGDLELSFATTGADLLTLTAEGSAPGRRLTLNVNLESASLAGARMVGFATKLLDAKTHPFARCCAASATKASSM